MRQSTLAFGQRPLQVPPITQPVQPLEESVPEASKEKVHPFFAKRARKEDGKAEQNDAKGKGRATPTSQPPTKKQALSGSSKSIPTLKGLQTPWPGKGQSSIQPDDQQSNPSSHSLGLTALEKRDDHFHEVSSIQEDENAWSWLHSTKGPTPETDGGKEKQNGHHLNVQDFTESHVNLRSCLDSNGQLPKSIKDAKEAAESKKEEKSSILWTDKWRPKEAAHVLGNEKQSVYMRDWLQALEITDRSPQARQIIKKAPPKRRGRTAAMKEMDDFIVGDDAEEEAWFDQFRKKDVGTESSQDSSASMSALADQHDLDFSKSTRLTNVMVIEGPSGCGKTSSVYACANELGFEVFELFPGMGKRSGVTLTAMVGDLCRNHMVSSGGSGGGAFQGKLIKTVSNGGEASLTAQSNGLKARQSLILVEEADTMYEDDKGFWLGLIELAGQSLRPIILTCNDISSIPIQGLPIQKILQFAKPSISLAVPYLQLISLCEGHQLDESKAAELYCDTIRSEEQSQYNEQLMLPTHGPLMNTQNGDIAELKFDLRQAIMQLQYECKWTKSSRRSPGKRLDDQTLRQLISFTDLESFVDSTFTKPFDRVVAEFEHEQFAPSPDEVQMIGKSIYHSPSKGAEVCLPMYGREADYVSILSASAEHKFKVQYSDLINCRHQLRAWRSKEIDDILESLNINMQSSMPSLEGVLEYAPFVHKMVSIDDQREYFIQTAVEAMLQEGAQEEASLIAKGYNRHRINMVRKQDRVGLFNLAVREANFMRWLLLDEQQLQQVRRVAPSLQW
ncbi:uncharacterized protein FA14DRAFT_161617 [Meira miltonrushii]|uniref:AAA+ ATPase domain-containing protein n=1 Tax=Meira miltonrushii TaxID=1280837 RepID=A0A316V9D9_9BASI|nr:uncharacterized protein FA14DRAFT_161617 [Meira miltonrushii]PWN34072.1 hypothetical protein FA14DRAFT_161617 [Meira miltonrushii]